MSKSENILKKHQLRKTQIRLDVLSLFLSNNQAMSHAQLESKVGSIDRVTLYRTLKTFEEKGIIHKAIDGTDTMRYALCHGECEEHHHEDHHPHFHCDNCGKTLCLDQIEVPNIHLPKGFSQSSSHLIIKGICEVCNE